MLCLEYSFKDYAFSKLRERYKERQGSGFKKIREAYHQAVHFREELEPKFYSDSSDFCLTLYNLNYGVAIEKAVVSDGNRLFDGQEFGFDSAFARVDIMTLAGITSTPAGELIKKLKKAKLIEVVRGQGKGKYKFNTKNFQKTIDIYYTIW